MNPQAFHAGLEDFNGVGAVLNQPHQLQNDIKGNIEMQNEDSTKLEKSTDDLPVSKTAMLFLKLLAGALVLFALSANIAGGFAMYGVTGNLMGSIVIGSIGALSVLVAVSVYMVTRKVSAATIALHAFGIALMSFAFVHFGQDMQMEGDAAKRELSDVLQQITDKKTELTQLETELDSISIPVDGMDEIAIAAKIKSLKNTPVKGGLLWDKSVGCTVEKYAPSCDVIRAWESKLKAEQERAKGTTQATIKARIDSLKHEVWVAERLPKALEEKISKNSVFGENSENAEMLLSIVSVSSATIFELMLGYVLLIIANGGKVKKGGFTLPKRSPNSSPNALPNVSGVFGFVSGMVLARHELEAKKAAEEAKKASADAEAKAHELALERQKSVTVMAAARAELDGKKLDMEMLGHEAGLKIDLYLKRIPEIQLKKLMARLGMTYHDKAGAKLLVNIKRALSLFDAGQVVTKRGLADSIVQKFDLPTVEKNGAWKAVNVGDVSPYVNDDYVIKTLIPAMVNMGLIQSEGGSKRSRYRWSTVIEARQAVGADTILESDVSAPVEPVRNQVRFEVIRGGVK